MSYIMESEEWNNLTSIEKSKMVDGMCLIMNELMLLNREMYIELSKGM